ncbi:MAG TPA: 50S ribosomal protein L3, partial [Syntrophorhabdus sp.]|nr:50S ribosomal protein L3 [Syntrophorhabdus sp.]HPB38862.1 50S ribosomal protein L3 [Syntrophorhabdus sp.]
YDFFGGGKMGLGLLGKKLGMTQIFDDHGNAVPVTVIKTGPCKVIQKKTSLKEGYDALQLGFEEVQKIGRVNKPMTGHFKKASAAPVKFLKEFRVTPEDVNEREIGSEITVDIFEPGEFVDVTGTSKGKGFAGVIRRHGFKGQPASRGTHEFFRHGGAIGQNMTPGRTFKGTKMPGHMGNRRVTVQSLKIVDVRGDTNILLVEGAIPGPTNGYVIVKKAVKK